MTKPFISSWLFALFTKTFSKPYFLFSLNFFYFFFLIFFRYCTIFNALKAFSCKIGGLPVFGCSSLKMIGFSVLSNLAVTARIQILLTAEKPSVTLTPGRLNTWGSLILLENALKTLYTLQYLTIHYSVIAR